MAIEAERAYPGGATSPAAARSFVSELLRLSGYEGSGEDACLVVNELVSNAVVHAGTPLRLRLRLTARRIHVEVEDGSPTLPRVRPLSPESERGRGLLLLSALSERWGATRRGAGKVVWCDLVLASPSRQSEVGRLAS